MGSQRIRARERRFAGSGNDTLSIYLTYFLCTTVTNNIIIVFIFCITRCKLSPSVSERTVGAQTSCGALQTQAPKPVSPYEIGFL